MHDFHTHFVPQEVVNWIKENAATINAKWETKNPKKEDFLIINEKWAFEFKDLFSNLSLYSQNQKEIGVTHSVLSPIPQLFLYDFEVDVTTELSTVYNNSLVQLVKENPSEFSALGTVPLNYPERAAEELKRSMDLGLKGAIIGPGTQNQLLTSETFKPFWEEANKQEAIIFIHPLLSSDPRIKNRKMPNLIGVPWETTVTATDLLLSGHLDVYPDVKILLAHGGGLLPYQIGRLNKGYQEWGDVAQALQGPPIDYLKRFWFDSVLWEPKALDYLTNLVGDDRVVPGSDYPFDLCTWPPQIKSDESSLALLNAKIKK